MHNQHGMTRLLRFFYIMLIRMPGLPPPLPRTFRVAYRQQFRLRAILRVNDDNKMTEEPTGSGSARTRLRTQLKLLSYAGAIVSDERGLKRPTHEPGAPMHITRVIRDANCDAAIYILLTSYLDAIRNQPYPHPMPDAALQLPLRGKHDVEERCRIMQRKRSTMSRYSASQQARELNEALEIFSCAAERLQVLSNDGGPRITAAELCAA